MIRGLSARWFTASWEAGGFTQVADFHRALHLLAAEKLSRLNSPLGRPSMTSRLYVNCSMQGAVCVSGAVLRRFGRRGPHIFKESRLLFIQRHVAATPRCHRGFADGLQNLHHARFSMNITIKPEVPQVVLRSPPGLTGDFVVLKRELVFIYHQARATRKLDARRLQNTIMIFEVWS